MNEALILELVKFLAEKLGPEVAKILPALVSEFASLKGLTPPAPVQAWDEIDARIDAQIRSTKPDV